MPRKLLANMTLDEMEDEVLFTEAALHADPDAAALATRTGPWIERIDAARPHDRKARAAVARGDAARQVAVDRLRRTCVAFGDDLYLAVGKNRKDARWQQFFPRAVSRFVRQPQGALVNTVRGWLSSRDPALDRHRTDLERWSQSADLALVDTSAVAIVRGDAHQTRGAVAVELTQERDKLHDDLSAIARERGLPRGWPDTFFRVETKKSGASENGQTPAKGAPGKGPKPSDAAKSSTTPDEVVAGKD
ncbi:MAG TPA: hypothetical protein VH877_32095 [Polyangia bacterium]|nr:hypothetical protein [Polyangia bacterium]